MFFSPTLKNKSKKSGKPRSSHSTSSSPFTSPSSSSSSASKPSLFSLLWYAFSALGAKGDNTSDSEDEDLEDTHYSHKEKRRKNARERSAATQRWRVMVQECCTTRRVMMLVLLVVLMSLTELFSDLPKEILPQQEAHGNNNDNVQHLQQQVQRQMPSLETTSLVDNINSDNNNNNNNNKNANYNNNMDNANVISSATSFPSNSDSSTEASTSDSIEDKKKRIYEKIQKLRQDASKRMNEEMTGQNLASLGTTTSSGSATTIATIKETQMQTGITSVATETHDPSQASQASTTPTSHMNQGDSSTQALSSSSSSSPESGSVSESASNSAPGSSIDYTPIIAVGSATESDPSPPQPFNLDEGNLTESTQQQQNTETTEKISHSTTATTSTSSGGGLGRPEIDSVVTDSNTSTDTQLSHDSAEDSPQKSTAESAVTKETEIDKTASASSSSSSSDTTSTSSTDESSQESSHPSMPTAESETDQTASTLSSSSSSDTTSNGTIHAATSQSTSGTDQQDQKEQREQPQDQDQQQPADNLQLSGSKNTSSSSKYSHLPPNDSNPESFWNWFQESKNKDNAEGSDSGKTTLDCPPNPSLNRLCLMIFKTLRKYKARSFLDISCVKNAPFMPTVVKKLSAEFWGFKYYCVDPSAERLDKYVRPQFPQNEFTNIEYMPIEWWQADLPKDMDVILVWDIISHTSYGRIWRLFYMISVSNAKKIIFDNYPEVVNDPSPQRKYVNVRRHPFKFDKPLDIIQNVTENGETMKRQLLIYDVSTLPIRG